jgi:hypothetical protein
LFHLYHKQCRDYFISHFASTLLDNPIALQELTMSTCYIQPFNYIVTNKTSSSSASLSSSLPGDALDASFISKQRLNLIHGTCCSHDENVLEYFIDPAVLYYQQPSLDILISRELQTNHPYLLEKEEIMQKQVQMAKQTSATSATSATTTAIASTASTTTASTTTASTSNQIIPYELASQDHINKLVQGYEQQQHELSIKLQEEIEKKEKSSLLRQKKALLAETAGNMVNTGNTGNVGTLATKNSTNLDQLKSGKKLSKTATVSSTLNTLSSTTTTIIPPSSPKLQVAMAVPRR